jgi:hypothetical protein
MPITLTPPAICSQGYPATRRSVQAVCCACAKCDMCPRCVAGPPAVAALPVKGCVSLCTGFVHCFLLQSHGHAWQGADGCCVVTKSPSWVAKVTLM